MEFNLRWRWLIRKIKRSISINNIDYNGKKLQDEDGNGHVRNYMDFVFI